MEQGYDKGYKRRRKGMMIVIFTLLALAAGLLWLVMGRDPATGYTAVAATTGELTTYYRFTGEVTARSRSTAVALAPLTVDRLYVASGEEVKKGDAVLRTTDGAVYRAGQDGTLGELTLCPGQSLPAGQPLFTIADYDDMIIRFLADEQDAHALKAGAKVTIDFAAMEDVGKREGTITYVAKEAADVSGGIPCFRAHAALNTPPMGLLCGMTAQVMLERERGHGVLLPLTAIMTDENNLPYVYYLKNGRMAAKYVSLGPNDGKQTVVLAGVEEGETVYIPTTTHAALDPMALLREEDQ